MAGIQSISPLVVPCISTSSRRIVKVVATARNTRMSFESMALKPHLHPTYDLKGVIKLGCLGSRLSYRDVTIMATIAVDMEVEANFLAKEDSVITGLTLADMVFHEVDPSLKVEWSRKDRDYTHKGLQFGKVYDKLADSIVEAERIALNFTQKMSGIATLTKVKMADTAHPACILEMRKTATGLRLVNKGVVLIDGEQNRRMSLLNMVLIKDNHISIAGGIKNAIKSVDMNLEQKNLQMEVEVLSPLLKSQWFRCLSSIYKLR
ncbi:nicotinate-nucleotide pyrophosphorylase [carboxylating], chloroplastic [Carya illinoinensis]|uniref:nicotinate-nucleotide pyrophosphorylase [carboxylating], chloroplastic n=1 Tax=Carya illinoinensis TaxID=32201 RepID=UPI001C719E64|nr:nicotinate-nucleotide pyrophosphorylase [carboxylating], chloroplastic [Carya illinoinensis]